jgi:hypothetical protein
MPDKSSTAPDDERKRDPQDVVGSEGGAGNLGNPSRVDRSGNPPVEQSPVGPTRKPDEPFARRKPSQPRPDEP